MTRKKTEHTEPEIDHEDEEGVKEDPEAEGSELPTIAAKRGGITFPAGTVLTSSGGWSSAGTITTGSGITLGSGGMITTTAPTGSGKKPSPSKMVSAPGKRPKKILVAFLDTNDEVEWCAKVHPDDIQVQMGVSDPATRMELGFWLIEAD